MHVREIFDPTSPSLLPAAVRVGDAVYAWRLRGPGSARAEGPVVQMGRRLDSMRAVLEAAGVGPENVARATGFIRDASHREAVYRYWDELYPDPNDRPAFKVLITDLEDGIEADLHALAFAGGRRERFDIEGVPARDPTVRLGPWIFSSRVHGIDRTTGEVPPGLEPQIDRAFENLGTLVGLAGGDRRHIAQITAYVRDLEPAPTIVRRLTERFAIAGIEPNVRIVKSFVRLQAEAMLEMSAAVGDKSAILDLANPALMGEPVPAGMSIGPAIVLPAIRGIEPATGRLAEGYEGQLRQALTNARRALERAGASMDNVTHAWVFLQSLDGHEALNRVWGEVFPDAHDRPPHVYVQAPLPAGVLAQVQLMALSGQRRTVLEIPGLAHRDPMSMGVRIGDFIVSSRIVGSNLATDELGATPQDQTKLALEHARTLLESAGAGLKQLTQAIAYVPDRTYRAPVTEAFRRETAALPNEPALDFVEGPVTGPPAVRLQIKAALQSG